MSSAAAAAGAKSNPPHPPGLRRREDLSVRYYPGIGSGGTDEILRPTLMTVGDQGRCYRIVCDNFGKKGDQLWSRTAVSANFGGVTESEKENLSRKPGDSSSGRNFGHHSNRQNQQRSEEGDRLQSSHRPHFQDDVYDEGQESGLELEGLEQIPPERGGGYSLAPPIPPSFFKFIIGSKGVTRANIESDTKCRLRIPRKGQEGRLVIEGATPAIVSHGKQRVDMVVWSNRFKEEPTHFISIPLNLPNLMMRLDTFQEKAMELCGKDRGVVPELFQDAEHFHITLGVLRIFSQEEEEKAIRVIQDAITEAREDLRDPATPLTIMLQGLDTMNDDPTSTRVVYSKVKSTDSTNRLQSFVDGVASRVIRGAPELMRREFERDTVKLHATVMNCSFLARCEDTTTQMEVHRGKRRPKQRDTFDATTVFKEFKNFDFGTVNLSNLHLSKRGERGPDGYYRCVQSYAV